MKIVVADLGALKTEETAAALACLPPKRRAEILGLASEQKRAQRIVAEATLRLEIIKTLCVPNENILFARSPSGKPCLKDFPSFCFNVSHSGDCAVCAFDRFPVGVDAETVRPVPFQRLAARCFSEAERAEMTGKKDPNSAFLRLWTVKESVIKQRGATLASELVRLNTAGSVTLGGAPYPCRLSSWGFDLSPHPRVCAADAPCSYLLSVCRAAECEGPTPEPLLIPASKILKEWRALCHSKGAGV